MKSTVTVTIHPDARFKGDRDKIRDAMLALYNKHGSLTAERVITAARAKSSPLHKEFTWDVKKAALQCWRERAQYLIRHISLEIKEVDTGHIYRGREFILKPRSKTEYVSIRTSLSDDEFREQTIAGLMDRLAELQEEIKQFKEFARVVAAIESVKQKAITKKAA